MSKHTIKALHFRYKLNNFKDVYVEGEADRRYFQQVARALDARDVKFYCVDSVELDADLFKQSGLISKLNRDKVRALIIALNPVNSHPVGIIDRDFSDWRKDIITHQNIVYTDAANTDMYSINQVSVNDLFEALNVKLNIDSFFRVLNKMFVLRYVATSEKVGLKILDSWTKHISYYNNSVDIDIEKLARLSNDRKKSLVDTGIIHQMISAVPSEQPDLLKTDFFNGHDAFSLLSTVLQKSRKKCHMNEDDIRDWMQFARCDAKNMSQKFIQAVFG